MADDLLKNHGEFIEMMEQLAEPRMACEEEANGANGVTRDANVHVHNHIQPSDYEYKDNDDEEEDEDEEGRTRNPCVIYVCMGGD